MKRPMRKPSSRRVGPMSVLTLAVGRPPLSGRHPPGVPSRAAPIRPAIQPHALILERVRWSWPRVRRTRGSQKQLPAALHYVVAVLN